MTFPYYQPYNYYPQQNQVPVQNQVLSGGFVPVRSEAEARNYPVAFGTSVTFKNETAPYCYTKTMGVSQLEAPKFEKYRLVKEEDEHQSSESAYATKEELVAVSKAIKDVLSEIEQMKADLYGVAGRKKKKEVTEDDE